MVTNIAFLVFWRRSGLLICIITGLCWGGEDDLTVFAVAQKVFAGTIRTIKEMQRAGYQKDIRTERLSMGPLVRIYIGTNDRIDRYQEGEPVDSLFYQGGHMYWLLLLYEGKPAGKVHIVPRNDGSGWRGGQMDFAIRASEIGDVLERWGAEEPICTTVVFVRFQDEREPDYFTIPRLGQHNLTRVPDRGTSTNRRPTGSENMSRTGRKPAASTTSVTHVVREYRRHPKHRHGIPLRNAPADTTHRRGGSRE